MVEDTPLPPAVQQSAADKLAHVVDQIVTLRVTTIVGAAHVDPETAVAIGTPTEVTFTGNAEQKLYTTAINMALGDYTQVLHPDFTTDQALAKLHQDAIGTARQVRADTVAILTALAKDLAQRL